MLRLNGDLMDYSETMEKVENFVKKFCSDLENPRKEEKRIKRIRNTAVEINEHDCAVEKVIEVASMLYGVAKHKGGMDKVEGFLDKLEIEDDEREMICECLATLDQPCGEHDEAEPRVVQTADVLATLSDDDWIEEQIENDPEALLDYIEKLKKRICVESVIDTFEETVEHIKKEMDMF
jgi:hypothetical protein